MRERIVAVGFMASRRKAAWQSPDLPAPTILADGPNRSLAVAAGGRENGGAGWLLVEAIPAPAGSAVAGRGTATGTTDEHRTPVSVVPGHVYGAV